MKLCMRTIKIFHKWHVYVGNLMSKNEYSTFNLLFFSLNYGLVINFK